MTPLPEPFRARKELVPPGPLAAPPADEDPGGAETASRKGFGGAGPNPSVEATDV